MTSHITWLSHAQHSKAVKPLLEKEAPGLSMAMISKSLAITSMAMLSRSFQRILLTVVVFNII